MPGKKRRFKPVCNYYAKKGEMRWHVSDTENFGAVRGYYFTTKVEAQEYANDLEKDEHAI